MKPELILQADILDIIFEGRNKHYGAYNLRKGYDYTMKVAMASVTTIVGVFLMISFFNKSVPGLPSGTVVMLPDTAVVISPPPEYKPPPPAEPFRQNLATVRNPSFVLTKDPDTDTLPTVDQLDRNVQIGLENRGGDSIFSDAPPPSNEPNNSATPARLEPFPAAKPDIVSVAEIMPEFPGGQAAFIRFLSRHLRVPENSMEPGQKIKIVVKFVVGREGELTDFVFVTPGGELFEQEVLRVMKKMPNWRPGSQNGEKVRVYFNLPIIFESPEE